MAGSCRVTRNGRPSLRADRWAGNSCRPLIQNRTFRFRQRRFWTVTSISHLSEIANGRPPACFLPIGTLYVDRYS